MTTRPVWRITGVGIEQRGPDLVVTVTHEDGREEPVITLCDAAPKMGHVGSWVVNLDQNRHEATTVEAARAAWRARVADEEPTEPGRPGAA